MNKVISVMLLTIISLILATLAIVSCNHNTDVNKAMEHKNGFKTIIVDSCEYLIGAEAYGRRGFGFFAHKGNCRYCKERKEKEESYENK